MGAMLIFLSIINRLPSYCKMYIRFSLRYYWEFRCEPTSLRSADIDSPLGASACQAGARHRLRTFPNLKPSTKAISLRLPQHLLDALKTASNARDVPYQSLIKVWLQEKVQRG